MLGGATTVLNQVFKKRTEAAREIAIEEMQKGQRSNLDFADADEFVAIVYRYIRAAREGAATLNLRLMAKVMRGQIVSESMYASDFLAYADIISTLRREEVVYLATLLKLTKEGLRLPKDSDPNDYYDVAQSVTIQLMKLLVETDFFKDNAALNACILAVQRTGFIRHVTSLASGGNIYAPSTHLEKLGKLACFEDALREEGVGISWP